MQASNYTLVGGHYAETAPLRNILAAQNVLDPRTQQPFSEALLFGIGGGINFAPFVMELEPLSTFVVTGRHKGNYKGGVFQEIISQRLGIPCLRKETSGEKAAQRHLTESLKGGRPMLAWVDLQGLSYYHLPEHYYKTFDHTVAVIGMEGEKTITLDDRSPKPWVMDWEQFIETRAAISAQKNRLLAIGAPEADLTVAAAIDLGLKHCVDNLLNPQIRNFGVSGIQKWQTMLRDTDSDRGWMAYFDTGRNAYCALRDIYDFIETGHASGGAGGGLLRYFFSDFLVEASEILDDPDLTEIGTEYYRIGKLWTALAETALPDLNESLKETKDLLLDLSALMESEGPNKTEEIATKRKRLNTLEKDAKKQFKPDPQVIAHIVDDMAEQLGTIHQKELEMAQRLSEYVHK